MSGLFINPSVSHASWWNPFTWAIFNKSANQSPQEIMSPQTSTSTIKVTSDESKPKVVKEIPVIATTTKGKERAPAARTPLLCTGAVAVNATPLNLDTLRDGVNIITDEKYYSVYGSNEDHIFYEIVQCSPQIVSADPGTVYEWNKNHNVGEAGHASGNTVWSYSWKEKNGKCTLIDVKVGLHISYTMPRWEQPADADEEAIKHWNRYLADLWKHERTHGNNSIEGAEKINSYLKNFTQENGCRDVKQNVSVGAQAFIDEVRNKDLLFDTDIQNNPSW